MYWKQWNTNELTQGKTQKARQTEEQLGKPLGTKHIRKKLTIETEGI